MNSNKIIELVFLLVEYFVDNIDISLSFESFGIQFVIQIEVLEFFFHFVARKVNDGFLDFGIEDFVDLLNSDEPFTQQVFLSSFLLSFVFVVFLCLYDDIDKVFNELSVLEIIQQPFLDEIVVLFPYNLFNVVVLRNLGQKYPMMPTLLLLDWHCLIQLLLHCAKFRRLYLHFLYVFIQTLINLIILPFFYLIFFFELNLFIEQHVRVPRFGISPTKTLAFDLIDQIDFSYDSVVELVPLLFPLNVGVVMSRLC